MKTHYCDQPYEILRLQDGEWVWCGYGDSRDEGEVTFRKRSTTALLKGDQASSKLKGSATG